MGKCFYSGYWPSCQGCGVKVGVVEAESEGILGAVRDGVSKNVPTLTLTSILNLN
jgi:hypothetical protein